MSLFPRDVRRREVPVHEKGAIDPFHALWIALPQADTNAERNNAPSWAHHHLHAGCILVNSGSIFQNDV